LSVVNAVAVVSLQEIAPAALQQHVFWGALLAGIAIYGPGAWSLERLLWPRFAPRAGAPGAAAPTTS
jgi:putative oxidoreductase